MAILEGAGRRNESRGSGAEDGVWVADAEWAKEFEGGEELAGDVREANVQVPAKFFLFGNRADPLSRDLAEACAEIRDSRGRQSEPDGVGVPAETREETAGESVMGSGDCIEQVKAGYRAARAMRDAVLVGDDERGATGAIDDTRGEDADYATMPAGGWFGGCGAFSGWQIQGSLRCVLAARGLRSR